MSGIEPVRWLQFAEAALQWITVNWLVQSTVILTAGLLLAALPRLKASARHGILIASLVLATVAPVSGLVPERVRVQGGGQGAGVRGKAQGSGARGQAPEKRQEAGAIQDVSSAPAISYTLHPTPYTLTQTPYTLLAGVWLIIALVRIAGLLLGLGSVRRLVRGASPVSRDRIYAACRYAVADVPVLESAAVSVPSVVGIRRPCIVAPLGLAETLEPQALRDVLFHEEAHARRRDPLFLSLAAFCHALLFWHPLAALARRRMESAAEDACDTHVLSRGVDAPAYARTLLTVLERAAAARPHPAACLLGRNGAGGVGSELRRRVTRILAGAPRTSPVMAVVAGGVLVAAAGSTVVAEIGRRPALPRAYRPVIASAVASTHPRASGTAALAPRPRTIRKADNARPASAAAPVVAAPAAALFPAERLAPAQPLLARFRDVRPRESRCVVYVLDVSGSMQPHLTAARTHILEMAQCLSPGDRFNVVAFDSEAQGFAAEAVAPAEGSLAAAKAWMEALPQRGGTNIAAGLRAAFATPSVTQVIIVSDGEAWSRPEGRASLAQLLNTENRLGASVQEVVFGDQFQAQERLLPAAPMAAPNPQQTVEAGLSRPGLDQ